MQVRQGLEFNKFCLGDILYPDPSAFIYFKYFDVAVDLDIFDNLVIWSNANYILDRYWGFYGD